MLVYDVGVYLVGQKINQADGNFVNFASTVVSG